MRFLIPVLARGLLCGCAEKEEEARTGLGFDAFVPKYNQYIRSWLKKQRAEAEKELAEATGSS